MARRKAAKLLAPASPAETSVVVPWKGTQLVGGDADGGAVGEDVGVQVDEAGRDELARRRSAPSGPCRRECRPPAPRSGRSGCRCRAWPCRFWLGSSTSPPLMTRSNLSLGPMAASAGPPGSPRPTAPAADAEPASARNSRREVAGMARSSDISCCCCAAACTRPAGRVKASGPRKRARNGRGPSGRHGAATGPDRNGGR